MAGRGKLIAAGVAAFTVCLVALVPAHQLAKRLPPGFVMTGVGGTIWSGRAATLAVDGAPLGAVRWFCRPWTLFVLRWSCAVTLAPAGGEISGDVGGGFDGREIEATDIRGQSPIAAFEGFATPRGWTGTLALDIEHIRVVEQRAESAAGKLYVRSLRGPGAGAQMLGDFELTVGEGAVGTDSLTGRLRDLGGPLRVRGAIELKRDSSYFLTGETAPGPGAGPAIFDSLAFLGPPDAAGRRPFTIEGSL